MKRLFASFVIFFAFFSTTTSFSKDITPMFKALAQSGVDYSQIGTICEQVARVELTTSFPSTQYAIVNGIQYSNGNRTLGELDVVVFDRKSKEAVMVGEVKCWRDLNGARRKAQDQRERFLSYIRSNAKLNFVMFHAPTPSGTYKFDQDQFEKVSKFISIAQLGSTKAGFDMDLSYTLPELMSLRQNLMKCQSQGQCKAHD